MCKKPLRSLTKSVATFLLGVGMTMQAHATSVQLTPSSVMASIGDTAIFDLSISDVTDLYGFQFSLKFDPNLVNIMGLTEGPALSTSGTTFYAPGAFDNLGGALELTGNTLIGAIGGFTGNGVLASISLKAIGVGVGDISINDLFLLDSSLSEITSTSSFASIEVQSATASVPEPPAYTLMLVALPFMVWMRRRK